MATTFEQKNSCEILSALLLNLPDQESRRAVSQIMTNDSEETVTSIFRGVIQEDSNAKVLSTSLNVFLLGFYFSNLTVYPRLYSLEIY
jgi:hypothetical protein